MEDGYSLDGAVKKLEKDILLIKESLAKLKQPTDKGKAK